MNQPRQPKNPPAENEGATHPGTKLDPAGQSQGIPDAMAGEPKGSPSSDRHKTETTPKR